MLLDVRGTSAVSTQYQLSTYSGVTFDYLSPTTLNGTKIWLVSSDSVTDNSIKIHFMAARPPQAVTDGWAQKPVANANGVMKYSVFLGVRAD